MPSRADPVMLNAVKSKIPARGHLLVAIAERPFAEAVQKLHGRVAHCVIGNARFRPAPESSMSFLHQDTTKDENAGSNAGDAGFRPASL